MKNLICPGCGGDIIVDENQDFGYCKYCGRKIMLHEHVKVDGLASELIENKLRSADAFWGNHHNYSEALKLYNEVAHEAANDYRGWWGMARVYSNNFTDIQCSRENFEKISDAAQKALNVAGGDTLSTLKGVWENYRRKVAEVDRGPINERSRLKGAMAPLQQRADSIRSELNNMRQKQSALQNEIKTISDRKAKAQLGIIAGIILFFGGELLHETFHTPYIIVAVGMFMVPICAVLLVLNLGRAKVRDANLHKLNTQYRSVENDYKQAVSQINQLNSQIDGANARIRIDHE